MPTSGRSTARKAEGRGVFAALSWRCRHCGRPLKVVTVELFGKPAEVPCWGSCGCEESRWDGTGVAPSEREWARAGIPHAFLGADCDLGGRQFDVEAGRSLYVHGPYGTGKTYFACALAKALVNMGMTVRFENSRRAMSEIQGMYSGKRSDVLERMYACRVLVLDDLGKEQPTANTISMLYEVIDSRHAAGKPIVVTTNFDRAALMARWERADAATAEGIVSRLCENADTLLMDGGDRRVA